MIAKFELKKAGMEPLFLITKLIHLQRATISHNCQCYVTWACTLLHKPLNLLHKINSMAYVNVAMLANSKSPFSIMCIMRHGKHAIDTRHIG